MAVFNLRFRTLSGQTYRLTVKSTDSIMKIDKDNPQCRVQNVNHRTIY